MLILHKFVSSKESAHSEVFSSKSLLQHKFLSKFWEKQKTKKIRIGIFFFINTIKKIYPFYFFENL